MSDNQLSFSSLEIIKSDTDIPNKSLLKYSNSIKFVDLTTVKSSSSSSSTSSTCSNNIEIGNEFVKDTQNIKIENEDNLNIQDLKTIQIPDESKMKKQLNLISQDESKFLRNESNDEGDLIGNSDHTGKTFKNKFNMAKQKKNFKTGAKSSTFSSSSSSNLSSSSNSSNEAPVVNSILNQKNSINILNRSTLSEANNSMSHQNHIKTNGTKTSNLSMKQNNHLNNLKKSFSTTVSSTDLTSQSKKLLEAPQASSQNFDQSNFTSSIVPSSCVTPLKKSQPINFNIENELIKYTKSLKLNGISNSSSSSTLYPSYLQTYKLSNHIRNGGFSEIYEGHNVKTNEPVIIKLIPKQKTKNWLMVHNKKYPAEILLHKMCNNIDGVVKMLEFYEQELEWIITMPKLLNCVDLFDYLESKQRGRLSEQEACHFFTQLVRINIDLLSQGVVHRDIKSENLLVDLDTMKLILIDFGASAIYRHNQQQQFYSDFHGTRQYKPPEYILNKKYSAQSSTIWTLGILLYDMCNGQLPFETEQEILEYNLQIKATVSDEYKNILFDCLNKDPTQRPSLNQLLEYEWCKKFLNERKDEFKSNTYDGHEICQEPSECIIKMETSSSTSTIEVSQVTDISAKRCTLEAETQSEQDIQKFDPTSSLDSFLDPSSNSITIKSNVRNAKINSNNNLNNILKT